MATGKPSSWPLGKARRLGSGGAAAPGVPQAGGGAVAWRPGSTSSDAALSAPARTTLRETESGAHGEASQHSMAGDWAVFGGELMTQDTSMLLKNTVRAERSGVSHGVEALKPSFG